MTANESLEYKLAELVEKSDAAQARILLVAYQDDYRATRKIRKALYDIVSSRLQAERRDQ